jgi:hypothetical protein
VNNQSNGILINRTGSEILNDQSSTFNNYGSLVNTSLIYNSGQFNVSSTGTVTGTGSFTQIAGTFTVDGTVTQAAVNINGGVLDGSGAINAAVNVNGGTLAPGHSAGTMTISTLNFTSGTINIEIGGTDAGQYDFLNITGGASFSAGTIHFSFIDGYLPTVGDTVSFLSALEGITGFGNLNFDFSGLSSGWTYFVDTYTNGSQFLRFTVQSGGGASVPEPDTIALFCLGGLLVWRIRKQNVTLNN